MAGQYGIVIALQLANKVVMSQVKTELSQIQQQIHAINQTKMAGVNIATQEYKQKKALLDQEMAVLKTKNAMLGKDFTKAGKGITGGASQEVMSAREQVRLLKEIEVLKRKETKLSKDEDPMAPFLKSFPEMEGLSAEKQARVLAARRAMGEDTGRDKAKELEVVQLKIKENQQNLKAAIYAEEIGAHKQRHNALIKEKIAKKIISNTKSLEAKQLEADKNKYLLEYNKMKQESISLSKQEPLKEQASALQQQSSRLTEIMTKFTAIVYFTRQIYQNINQAVQATRELRLAEIFSGRKFGNQPFMETMFGMDVSGAGKIYQAAHKTPFADEFLSKENIRNLAFFQQILGQNVDQLIPFATSLRTIDKEAGSVNDVMLLLSNAMMKSEMEVGSFTSIMAQAIPYMKELGVSTQETVGLITALSQLGTTGRALGMGLPAFAKSLYSPSATGKKWYNALGIDAAKTIKESGIIGLLELIKEKTDSLTDAQRGEAFKNIVTGRGEAVFLGSKQNLENIIRVTREVGDLGAARQKQNEVERMNAVLMDEVAAQAKNIKTQFIDILGTSDVWKYTLLTVKEIMIGIGSTLKAINDSPAMKNLLTITTLLAGGLVYKIAVAPLVGGMSKLLIAGLAQSQAGLFTLGLASTLKAALAPFIPIVAGVAAVALAVSWIHNSIKEKERKKTEETKTLFSDYQKLMYKEKHGGLTKEEADRFRKAEQMMIDATSVTGSGNYRKLEIHIVDDGRVRQSDKDMIGVVIRGLAG